MDESAVRLASLIAAVSGCCAWRARYSAACVPVRSCAGDVGRVARGGEAGGLDAAGDGGERGLVVPSDADDVDGGEDGDVGRLGDDWQLRWPRD
eukprot:3195455-Pleurochrysis_carterae.AAC.4